MHQQNRSKGKNMEDFLVSYDFDGYDDFDGEEKNDYMLLKIEYKLIVVVIEPLSSEVDTLTTSCRDHENIMNIFNKKDNSLR